MENQKEKVACIHLLKLANEEKIYVVSESNY